MDNNDYVYVIEIDLPANRAKIDAVTTNGTVVFSLSISDIKNIPNIAKDIKTDVMPIVNNILGIFK